MTIKNVTKYMVFGLLAFVLPASSTFAWDVLPATSLDMSNLPIMSTQTNTGPNPGQFGPVQVFTGNPNLVPVLSPNANLPQYTPDPVSASISIDDISSISDEDADIEVSYAITNAVSSQAIVYVKYGTSTNNLNHQSDVAVVTDFTDTVSFTLDDLNDDTHYYARAYVVVDGETFTSSSDSFTTDEYDSNVSGYNSNSSGNNSNESSQVVYTYSNAMPTLTPIMNTPTVYTATTKKTNGVIVSNISGNDALSLVIKNNVTQIAKGDTVTYMIEYKNISTERISHARLVVNLPVEITVTSATMGMQAGQNLYVIDVGTLEPNEDGTLLFTGVAKSTPRAGFVTAIATMTADMGNTRLTVDSADADGFVGAGSVLAGSALQTGAAASIMAILVILIIAGLIIFIAHQMTKDRPHDHVRPGYKPY